MLVAVGPDGKSFRVFVSRIDGKDAEFFLKGETEGEAKWKKPEAKTETKPDAKSEPSPAIQPVSPAKPRKYRRTSKPIRQLPPSPPRAPPKPWILLDSTTASEWNFQGCAISGPSQGKCLDRIPALKDYWFDWRNYHPDTTIYKR